MIIKSFMKKKMLTDDTFGNGGSYLLSHFIHYVTRQNRGTWIMSYITEEYSFFFIKHTTIYLSWFWMCLVWRWPELILTELILSKSELNVIDLCFNILMQKLFLSIHIVWIFWIKIAFECIITKMSCNIYYKGLANDECLRGTL
jgi:hypothetical protein